MTRDRYGEYLARPSCPRCGRGINLTTAGVRRKHRIHDDPAAAWCPESGQPAREDS